MNGEQDPKVKTILHRLREPEDNPVRRARRMVEAQVPANRRGPGWDRHWRELEAYLDEPGCWSGKTDVQDDG
ncbi:hypothetical protein [Sphingobium sp. CFD-1]|jgi:hypothetical protein|uniref:hypothetical protein n=1 Tax=Sphingobium sp. CFD-1 TaxID=2878545 RepID=UPI00214CA8E7|nr:hypothetical protein [Sphingobium sp. CFD-1]